MIVSPEKEMNQSKRNLPPLTGFVKALCPDRVEKALSALLDMREMWRINNVTWRQVIAVYEGRGVWLMVLRNFRELEGSWPAALRKMARIFQGKVVRRSGNPRS